MRVFLGEHKIPRLGLSRSVVNIAVIFAILTVALYLSYSHYETLSELKTIKSKYLSSAGMGILSKTKLQR